MNNIIKPNGEYITTTFTGKSGTWVLIGSECKGRTAMECQDEFKNVKTGERMTLTRLAVYEQAELSNISVTNLPMTGKIGKFGNGNKE